VGLYFFKDRIRTFVRTGKLNRECSTVGGVMWRHMELVTNTTHTHSEWGSVTIERICREYAVFDTEQETGSVPGGWVIRYSTQSGDTGLEPAEEFAAALDSK
jgi:hypothetical protein